MHQKLILLKGEKKIERKGNKKRNEKRGLKSCTRLNEKRCQNLADVSPCRAVFSAKLNETVQTAPMKRNENIVRRIFTHNRF